MFPGGSHDTIAGPDAWVVMDNGDARVDAAWKLTQYLTAPDQVLADSLATGHLPTRSSVGTMPGFAPFATSFPGIDVFATNLDNVKKARPSIAAVPADLAALGNAVTSVVLGKATPRQALADAAQTGGRVPGAPAEAAPGERRRLQRVAHSEHVAGWAFAAPAMVLIVALRARPDRVVVRAVVPEVEPAGAGAPVWSGSTNYQRAGATTRCSATRSSHTRHLHGAVRAAVGRRRAARPPWR